jgi:hypothetical protein
MLLITTFDEWFNDELKINHGYKTPKQALETNFAASCGVLHPPLCGIVQLANSTAPYSDL